MNGSINTWITNIHSLRFSISRKLKQIRRSDYNIVIIGVKKKVSVFKSFFFLKKVFLFSLEKEMWDNMLNVYKKSRAAQTFLSNYEYDDVGVAILGSHSTVVWTISPPDKLSLINDLRSG